MEAYRASHAVHELQKILSMPSIISLILLSNLLVIKAFGGCNYFSDQPLAKPRFYQHLRGIFEHPETIRAWLMARGHWYPPAEIRTLPNDIQIIDATRAGVVTSDIRSKAQQQNEWLKEIWQDLEHDVSGIYSEVDPATVQEAIDFRGYPQWMPSYHMPSNRFSASMFFTGNGAMSARDQHRISKGTGGTIFELDKDFEVPAVKLLRLKDFKPKLSGEELSNSWSQYFKGPKVRTEIKNSLEINESLGVPEALKDIMHMVEKRDGYVTVMMNSQDVGQLTTVQKELYTLFLLSYWQSYQRAYRQAGLVPNNMEASLGLLMGWVRNANTKRKIFFVYDQRIWNSLSYRITQESGGAQDLSEIFIPLLPTMGLTVTYISRYTPGITLDTKRPGISLVINNNIPFNGDELSYFEYGRLFYNDRPDPLQLLAGPAPENKKLSLNLFYVVTQLLNKKARVFADAYSEEHRVMYQSTYRFTPYDAFTDLEWGPRQAVRLSQSASDYLVRLEELLKR